MFADLDFCGVLPRMYNYCGCVDFQACCVLRVADTVDFQRSAGCSHHDVFTLSICEF